ncbi:MAG: FAD-dependent oxidoreductase [Flavobacteriales bacterium]|nr:FAD-dependent oxidoreductase [Flavobacteriales bacterium]MBK6943272.1 FAD-dependent oxidoreductase [Flavobacteriales bacterium]MBK9536197.1 FAD-dependent oxidoreductase [Flavobacteriales bacterium]MBP9139663.1 FAD-dependent oxidoreductase [Flavobacteriales bacterium]HQV53152.1 FAD-dependent oxidoreductase [Flavobacteriales bacterium]
MAEYKKPTTEAEFNANFHPKKPLMTDTEAYYESSRCLYCYDAPCVTACPTGIDIPQFIRQINSGTNEGAAKTIYDSNWMGHACGNVCPTEELCEGACVYNHSDVKPIEIGRLQAHATAEVIRTKKKLFRVGKDTGKKVAVIGAGPAGISAACELRMLGHAVTIYEARALPSGLCVHGVAPYKLTNEEALDEMAYLQEQFGFDVHYNKAIAGRADLEKLEKDFDAIFIGIGLGSTSKLGVIGEDKKGVLGALEYAEELRMKHHKSPIGNKVIVLGGGNTAMDAASESCRMGAESVIIAYRRGADEMGAYSFEFDLAKKSGAKALFNVTPVEIMGNGSVTGVKFIRNKAAYGKIEAIAGSEFIEPCDMVLLGTGQGKQVDLLEQISGVKLEHKSRILDDRGRLVVNEHYQTNNPKYFAAGDAVNGGVEVVNAAAEAKKAAHGINAYLNN